MLATSHADKVCDIPGADIHGHAWMVEPEAEWKNCRGAVAVTAPTKPVESAGGFADPGQQTWFEREKGPRSQS